MLVLNGAPLPNLSVVRTLTLSPSTKAPHLLGWGVPRPGRGHKSHSRGHGWLWPYRVSQFARMITRPRFSLPAPRISLLQAPQPSSDVFLSIRYPPLHLVIFISLPMPWRVFPFIHYPPLLQLLFLFLACLHSYALFSVPHSSLPFPSVSSFP